ncbi:MAG: hypothetical protein K0Q72_2312 [Armatimonadetes bacterium]|nr:hypothetical protein [Armatimonadota bacterium]
MAEDLYLPLKEATRNAFLALKRDHPGERFYAFGLYTNELGEYLSPTANTEEALLRRSGGNARSSLRWSPCDWEYHLEGNGEYFGQIQRLLDAAPDPYDSSIDEEPDPETEFTFDICVRVLRDLDDEGLFGGDEERSGIVISLWMGDQSDEERVLWAQQLNPEPVWSRFEEELPYCREWPPEEQISTS